MNEKLQEYLAQQEIEEAIENRNTTLAMGRLMHTKDGETLFRYLFKSLDVGVLPDRQMKGEELHEYLGFLRAGNSIFKQACVADSEKTSNILAKIEREKYADLYHRHKLESELTTVTNDTSN